MNIYYKYDEQLIDVKLFLQRKRCCQGNDTPCCASTSPAYPEKVGIFLFFSFQLMYFMNISLSFKMKSLELMLLIVFRVNHDVCLQPELFHKGEFLPLDPTQDLIFPPELIVRNMLRLFKQINNTQCYLLSRGAHMFMLLDCVQIYDHSGMMINMLMCLYREWRRVWNRPLRHFVGRG